MSLPLLFPAPITAKVDTGAKTSSLHAVELETIVVSGAQMARFVLQGDPGSGVAAKEVEAPIVDFREVRSSNGTAEVRPVIRTDIRLGHAATQIELTLTNREQMRFRMLLGRRFLKDRYRVDPGRSFLQTNSEAAS